jgi:hypothetical protein
MYTEKEQAVLDLLWEWAGINGAHHKDWLLDQILKEITGWEVGIPP